MSLRCWCFWRLSRKRLTIYATTHIFLERYFRDLSENVLVVALIVSRFRGKRQKLQHRRLNSYRGDYTILFNLLCGVASKIDLIKSGLHSNYDVRNPVAAVFEPFRNLR